MSRLIPFSVVLCCWSMLAPLARGATIVVQLFPLTGEVRFQNFQFAEDDPHDSFDFVYYTLTSSSGALNPAPAVWKSINETYDASGSGFIDPLNDWIVLSAETTELTEGVVPNPGGSLAPFRSVSLGNIWDPEAVSLPGDIMADFAQVGSSSFGAPLIGLALDGDYYLDGVIDALDYGAWKDCYGESANICSQFADGNLDGIVNAADYTVWRNNFGNALTGAASSASVGAALLGAVTEPGMGVAAAIPEPSTALLMLAAAPFWFMARWRGSERVLRSASVRYCNRSNTAS